MKGDLTEKAKSGMDSAKAKMDEMKSDATSAADPLAPKWTMPNWQTCD